MRIIITLLLLAFAACGADCRSECEKRGGHLVKYNCHKEMQETLMGFDSNGIPQYFWMDETVCSRACDR